MLLEIQNLSVRYVFADTQVKAVEDFSLDVQNGEIVGIVGESGCGKSTLACSIIRLVPPPGVITSGKIALNGRDVLAIPESRLNELRGKQVTYVPQGAQNALNPLFRVEHQIADPIRYHLKLSRKNAVEVARESLELVGITGSQARQFPHEYSGGMKQRALIALALALGSKLVLLDEPTTALDVLIQKQILSLISSLRSKYHTAFILISHDLAMVSSICDRIAMMYAGRLVELASTDEILSNPLHPYTKALLFALPRVRFSDDLLTPVSGAPPNLWSVPSGCSFHPRCIHATEVCSEKVPVLEDILPQHSVECHHAREINAREPRNIS